MTEVAQVINAARSLAGSGETHEAIAQLLKTRHKLQNELGATDDDRNEEGGRRKVSKERRAKQNAVDALSDRIKPLLETLRENVYLALKINNGASPDEAKKAYRKLALKFHPDKSEGTTELFTCIQDAFERFQSGKQLIVNKSKNKAPGGSSFARKYHERQANSTSKRSNGSNAGRRPSGPIPLQSPQNCRMSEHTTTSITVSWDPPPGAASQVSCYELQFKEADEREWHLASNSLSRTSCQKHNLRPGAAYRFRVRALHSLTGEWSPFSGTCSATTMNSVPGRPNIIRLNPKPNMNSIQVVWESGYAYSNNSKYALQWRKKGKGNPWEQIGASDDFDASQTTHLVRDLDLHQTYEFRCRAMNNAGSGPWSEIRTWNDKETQNEPTINVIRTKPYPDRTKKIRNSLGLSEWHTWDEMFTSENPFV